MINQDGAQWNKPIRDGSLVEFDYVNHRGKHERRTVIVRSFSFGYFPDYYETPRLLLTGHCLDRGAFRSFDAGKITKLDVKSF